ncbi:hypothetical protein DFH29DRAFT_1075157 [Suillus ampliporus]|nr:hypothetical protein DFH29DRAFT_1075157 [Suillus ampliporus]
MTYAPYASSTAVMDITIETTNFADSAQQEASTSSFLALSNSTGLAGITQYQFGSNGITLPSSGTQSDLYTFFG